MASLTQTSNSSPSSAPWLYLEPDDEWKQTLRLNIEAGLRSMVDVAQQKLDDGLAKGFIGPEERDRLTTEHLAALATIRQLAEEQFRMALECKRQERRWVSDQQLDRAWSESLTKIRQQRQKIKLPAPSLQLRPTRKEGIYHEPNMTTCPITQKFWNPSITPEEDIQTSRTKRARRGSITSSVSPFKAAFPHLLDSMSADMDCDSASIHSIDQEWNRVRYTEEGPRKREEEQRQKGSQRLVGVVGEIGRGEEDLERKGESREEDVVKRQQVSKLMEMELSRKEEEARQKEEEMRWKERELDRWEEELRRREEDLERREAKMCRRTQTERGIGRSSLLAMEYS